MKKAHKQCSNCKSAINQFMNFCPTCGEEQLWTLKISKSICDFCSTGVDKNFNFCFACGTDINPSGWNEIKNRISEIDLKYECDYECGGKLQEFMAFCPWCGKEQTWDDFYGDEYCDNCNGNLSDNWYYCVWCGEAIDWGDQESWARIAGYERPFYGLVQASKEFRENLRKTLNFDWAQASKFSSESQAREIIDCNLKGISARMNNRAQKFLPFWRNINWREIIEKILQENNIYYASHLDVEDLEIVLLEKVFNTKMKSEINKSSISTTGIKGLNKKAGLILDIIKDLDSITDDILGSTNKPALNCVLSICLWLHPEFYTDRYREPIKQTI